MKDENQQTVKSYEEHVQEYIKGTPQTVDGVDKEWTDAAIDDLPRNARILEFGSAFGRDAEYIQKQGFSIECTDAAQAFVDLLKQKGFNVRRLDAINDELGGPYNLIFARAVLLHFTREQTEHVLRKVFNALKANGKFAFSLVQGDDEEWSYFKFGAPRYFCYWREPQIRKYLEKAGFRSIDIKADQAAGNAKWLHIIAQR